MIVSNDYDLAQVGTLVACRLELWQVLGVCNGNGYARGLHPIGDVARCHQCRPRHRDEASPDAAQHYFPPFHEAREHGHHALSRPRSDAGQRVRDLLRTHRKLAVGHVSRRALTANPKHSPLFGVAGPSVEDLIGPVISFRIGQREGTVGLAVVADQVLLVHHDVLEGISPSWENVPRALGQAVYPSSLRIALRCSSRSGGGPVGSTGPVENFIGWAMKR